MKSQIQLSFPKFTLEPGAHVKLPIQGDFIMCEYADRPLKIQFDDDQEIPLAEGFELRPDIGFRSITVINNNNSKVLVNLTIGYGSVTDKRVSIAGSIETKEKAASEFVERPTVTVAGNSVEKILDVNLSRRSLMIRNLSTNSRVWVKSENNNVAAGAALEGLDVYTAAVTSQIFVFNQSSQNVEISVAELVG